MIEIREFEEKDWKRLCEIHDEGRIIELTGSVDLKAFKTLEETYDDEGLFDDQLWVAILENEIVGFIAYEIDEITWLYTDPKYYRKGIATALVQQALSYCNEDVKLEVLYKNEAALKFYEKMGFEKLKLVEGKLTGNETFPTAGYIMTYKNK